MLPKFENRAVHQMTPGQYKLYNQISFLVNEPDSIESVPINKIGECRSFDKVEINQASKCLFSDKTSTTNMVTQWTSDRF